MLAQSAGKERGQALIILVLAMVALLGFAGVALDGGNIYAEQRRAQAAADSAALASAYKAMRGAIDLYELRQAAMSNAAQNGYDNNSVNNWVVFYNPPIDGRYVGNPRYFEVVITRIVPTTLAHLVYRGPWQVTVHAVAKWRPPVDQVPFSGQAIMATSPSACQALWFHGTGDVLVDGAGVFSNSNCPSGSCSGGPSSSAGVANGNGALTVVGGDIGTVGGFYVGGSSSVSPAAQSCQAPLPEQVCPPLPEPAECGSPQASPSGDATLNPGTYSDISVGSNKTVKLRKGIYCLNGQLGDLRGTLTTDLNGNGIQDADEGAMLYIENPNGNIIRSNAQANIVLWALQDTTWRGMAIQAPTTPCGVACGTDGGPDCSTAVINGGANSDIVGTIYMPSTNLSVNGNSGTFALHSQIIANTVDVAGTGGVTVVYDPNDIYAMPVPPAVTLVR